MSPPPRGGVTQVDGVVATSGQLPSDISTICSTMIDGALSSNTPPSAITVTGSPFTYQNVLSRPAMVLVSGGTVTTISISRDGSVFFLVGLLAGQFHLCAGDFLRVVYVLAPTMTLVPF